MRIVYKGNKIVAQIVYEVAEPEYTDDGNVMGIDLGIKCLLYRIYLMAVLSSMAMAVKINICAGIINIFARN